MPVPAQEKKKATTTDNNCLVEANAVLKTGKSSMRDAITTVPFGRKNKQRNYSNVQRKRTFLITILMNYVSVN